MQLRCDFRRYYGCSFDEVDVGECLDLVDGLPDGSMYVRAVCPSRAWTESRVLAIDLMQEIRNDIEAMLGVPAEKRTHFNRPWDELLKAAQEEQAKAEVKQAEEARKYIQNQKWEAI